LRLNFIYKLFLPLIVIAIMMIFFAYKLDDIATLVNRELQVANQKELKLEKNVKFIKNTLVDMKTTIIENILDKKDNTKDLKDIKNKFYRVKKVLSKIKSSEYFQTEDKKEILKNLEARINGYYSILERLPEEFQENYEDGTYSMISLISINKKLEEELIKLQKITKEILSQKVFYIVSKKIDFYSSILGFSFLLLFIGTYLVDKQILNSIKKLKE